MAEFELCHCGKPLHYLNPKIEALVRAMVQELGPTVPVVVDDHTWLVPRHFIALHGLKAQALPTLGFQELKKCPK
jgi:hypothetical protein